MREGKGSGNVPNYTGGHKFHASHIYPQGSRLSQHLYNPCIRFYLIFFIIKTKQKKNRICVLDPVFGHKTNPEMINIAAELCPIYCDVIGRTQVQETEAKMSASLNLPGLSLLK